MSRSWIVAMPSVDGLISIHEDLCSYRRIRKSGLVDRLKIGCSIEAISAFGAASKISHTKKSGVGYLSGNNGERFVSSFDTSHTSTNKTTFHTPCQANSNFTHWHRRLDTSHTLFRYPAHQSSTLRTPSKSTSPAISTT